MTTNPELVYQTEKGVTVRVDAEALTTLVQEMLCEGKLTLLRVEDKKEK